MLAALVLAASVTAEPSPQTLVFYNARVALREGRPAEALKLWLLRNVVASDEGHVGRYDAELKSVTWAALGDLGLCGDGYSKDQEGGAGLWPIAVHNQVVGELIRGPIPSVQSPFDAFDAARQQRKVSLNDVLDPAELRTVTFFRTGCVLADSTMLAMNELYTVDATDRLKTAPVMRKLLLHALDTLDRSKVESVALLEARIFDIDLAMVQLAERRARQKAMQEKMTGRRSGLSDVANAENAEAVRKWPPGSRQERVLKASLGWTPDEWLTLSPQRRQFLFAQARAVAPSREVVDALALGIADRLSARGEGEELESWLGFLELQGGPSARRSVVTVGDRGKQLLALEPSTGFRERAVIALHRGVAALESGQQLDALRSFGFAMAHADESRKAAVVLPLARRWLSYVLSRYSTDAEALGILRALVPRQELNVVLEDLLWRAALRADQRSFDTISASVQRGGSLDARIAKLQPLAKGDVGALATKLRDAALEEPHLTLRFVRQVLEKLEAEDADVRLANVPMLKALLKVLEAVSQSGAAGKSQARLADELTGRTQGILEGLSKFDATEQGRARSLALRHDTFAGNIRLAPADPLPWPFEPPTVSAAPVFVPLKLQPLEWKNAQGQLVFGWRVTE